MKYYKKDIALEQINTSIKLFFEGKNDISVHSLIHATKIMLEDLDKKKGTNYRIESELREDITKIQRNKFFDQINEFPNFCKHADKDDSDFLDTKIKLVLANEYNIYYCIRLFQTVFGNKYNNRYFVIYLYYLSICGRYNFIFKNIAKYEPNIAKEIKNSNKEIGIVKKNPYLKKRFYKLLIHSNL